MQTAEFGYHDSPVRYEFCKSVHACNSSIIFGHLSALLCLLIVCLLKTMLLLLFLFADDALVANVTTFPTV